MSVTLCPVKYDCTVIYTYVIHIFAAIIGGASAASEATLSSCPLRFAVCVGGFSTCNQSLRQWRQIKRSQVRFPHWNFFFPLLFFFFLSHFFPFIFSSCSLRHKHFSSIYQYFPYLCKLHTELLYSPALHAALTILQVQSLATCAACM